MAKTRRHGVLPLARKIEKALAAATNTPLHQHERGFHCGLCNALNDAAQLVREVEELDRIVDQLQKEGVDV